MATRAIKPKRDDSMLAGFQSMPERAPSILREDRPTITRILALVGVLFFAVGILSWLAPLLRFNYLVNLAWGGFFLSLGSLLLIFHAFSDKDVQFRRVHMCFAFTLILVGLGLRVLVLGGSLGGYFQSLGIPCLLFGLLISWGVLRNETDPLWRMVILRILAVLAAVMIGAGLLVGQFNQGFLLREGVLLLSLGLLYFAVRLGFEDSDETHFWSGVALGVAGFVTVVLALVRVFSSENFTTDSAFPLVGFGTFYVLVSLAMVSDLPVIVLTRRELASYFYSPVGYLVLFGMMMIAWVNFWTFIGMMEQNRGVMPEPIITQYIFGLITIIGQIFVVPVITMRLLSEETRTGTLEVLLTAPVNALTVVLSKFFAALAFYMLTWVPAWIFLIALRFVAGEEFDYRPVLSFNLALLATGAGFCAMGLFFSSITSNQIIAAVLTFVGMMVHLAAFILKFVLQVPTGSGMHDILVYVSFLDAWLTALEGHLAPRFLMFHVSATVFFLFLTVQVLETRKWK